jgi:hypothetical protein
MLLRFRFWINSKDLEIILDYGLKFKLMPKSVQIRRMSHSLKIGRHLRLRFAAAVDGLRSSSANRRHMDLAEARDKSDYGFRAVVKSTELDWRREEA